MDTQDQLLKEIEIEELEIGVLKFYKKPEFLDLAYSSIPLKNGYILYITCRYPSPIHTWDIKKSIFDIKILNKHYNIVELYDELDDIDPDSLAYRLGFGVWEELGFKDVINKYKLVSSLGAKL